MVAQIVLPGKSTKLTLINEPNVWLKKPVFIYHRLVITLMNIEKNPMCRKGSKNDGLVNT